VASGGCYFNNGAVAAVAALEAGAERVMLLNWGVHAAAGSAELFADDPSVLVASLHRADECVCVCACVCSALLFPSAAFTSARQALCAARSVGVNHRTLRAGVAT
jgi:hypothetical protein